MVLMKNAMMMNSSFYDSLCTSTTWTTPCTLVQLIFNNTLLSTWLNTLLSRIYQFEVVFLPLCLYPVRSEIFLLMQELYNLYMEAKMLTQCAILICDGIQFQIAMGQRCHDLRCHIKNLLPQLAPLMEFFAAEGYGVLDVVLNQGWDKYEQTEGECSVVVRENLKRKRIDMSVPSVVWEMDSYFSENYRSMKYWLSDNSFPLLKGGREFLQEALEILSKFIERKDSTGERKIVADMEEKILNALFKKLPEDVKVCFFANIIAPGLLHRRIGHVLGVIAIMEDDGLVNAGGQDNLLDWLIDEQGIPSTFVDPLTVLFGSARTKFKQLEDNCCAYFALRLVIAKNMVDAEKKENTFLQLFLNSCRSRLAEIAGRIYNILQEINHVTPCPSAKSFVQTQEYIRDYVREDTLSVESAITIVKSVQSKVRTEASSNPLFKDLKAYGSIARDFIEVKESEFSEDGNTVLDWLNKLEAQRCRLLEMIAALHFHVGKDVDGELLFPFQEVVEHRFVEEMASLKKWTEVSNKKKEHAVRLMKLLARRMNWLQETYLQLTNDCLSGTIAVDELVSRRTVLLEALIPSTHRKMSTEIRLRMLAVTMDLKAIFSVYLSQYGTTHPITDVSFEVFEIWMDSQVETLHCKSTWQQAYMRHRYWQDKSTMRIGPEYAENLLDHCCEVWNVPGFCCDPSVATPCGSIHHAQQILTAFTKLFLMTAMCELNVEFNRYFTRNMIDSVPCFPHNAVGRLCRDHKNLINEIVEANIVIRRVLLNEESFGISWQRAGNALKDHFKKIWSGLCGFPFLPLPLFEWPEWLRRNPGINTLFDKYVTPARDGILQTLRFQEFVRAVDSSGEVKLPAEPSSVKPKNEASQAVGKEPRSPGNVCKCTRTVDSSVQVDLPAEPSNGEKPKNKASQTVCNQPMNVGKNDKRCSFCKMESKDKKLKVCAKCKEENWTDRRYYCSRHCQEREWFGCHRKEHEDWQRKASNSHRKK